MKLNLNYVNKNYIITQNVSKKELNELSNESRHIENKINHLSFKNMKTSYPTQNTYRNQNTLTKDSLISIFSGDVSKENTKILNTIQEKDIQYLVVKHPPRISLINSSNRLNYLSKKEIIYKKVIKEERLQSNLFN